MHQTVLNIDTGPDPILRLRRLTFAYPGRPETFRNLEFTFRPGERIGLFGPNGSGKSSLFQLVMGFLRPTEGSIEVFGGTRRKDRDFEEVRRRLGLLFQNSDDQLFSPTVEEDVAFGPLNLGKNRKEASEIVARCLEQVGLTGQEKRITHRLSGGEKKRAALASVLAMQPDALLLDEPFAGLDEASSLRIEKLLLESKTPFLLVEHDRERLERLCGKCYELDRGRLFPCDPNALI